MFSKIMRISFIFISFLSLSFPMGLNAKTINVDYSIEFGIIGEVARAKAKFTSNRRSYTINASVVVTGMIAKMVTDNLKERHISTGHIVRGLLVTDTYQMIKSYGEYKSTTIYHVNHKKKRVTRHSIIWKKDKVVRNEKVNLGYYAKDDMMTLFLNLSKHIKNKNKSKNYRFKVVGADRKNGRVDVVVPSTNALKQMKILLGEGTKEDWYSKVVMHRKLYNSKKGELDIQIGKDGIVKQAVLKDLIFFGDVRVIRQ